MTQGAVSHDKITRFLSQEEFDSPKLWRLVKPLVREIEDEESGVLIIDDTIEEKPYTELESELVLWHFDHSKGRSVKGMNLLSTLYLVGDVSIPVAFELVNKTELVFDKKNQKYKRKSPITKNEHYTKTIRTQSNHVFASIYAFVKLERMKVATKLIHFALRSRMVSQSGTSGICGVAELTAARSVLS